MTFSGKKIQGGQVGTTEWSMNVAHMSNAKKGPIKDFNAYQEFTDVELDGQILACCMVHFDMKTIDGIYLIDIHLIFETKIKLFFLLLPNND